MKKKGFTIAEVLIALTIIGVISAIIIPQFVTSTHNQAHASKLATVSSDLANALGVMMLRENVGDIFETDFGKAYTNSSTNINNIGNALGRYMKVSQAATSTSDLGYIAYNPSDFLMQAAFAEEGEEEHDDICNGDSASWTQEIQYLCGNNHCMNNYHETEDGSGVCCPNLATYRWDPQTQKCVPINGEDVCRIPGLAGHDDIDCRKFRCIAAFGIFNEHDTDNPCSYALLPLESSTPSEVGSSVMHTIRNTVVNSNNFNFVFGIKTAGGANIFFKAPNTTTIADENGNVTRRFRTSTIYIDVNGSAMPNKFGRDVFAYLLTEDGQLLPFGSESVAEIIYPNDANDSHTWKGETELYGCTGNNFCGLGCTARLIENNYKVDY